MGTIISAREIESTRKLPMSEYTQRVIGAVHQRFTIFLSATRVLTKDLVQTKLNDGALLDAVVRVKACLHLS